MSKAYHNELPESLQEKFNMYVQLYTRQKYTFSVHRAHTKVKSMYSVHRCRDLDSE